MDSANRNQVVDSTVTVESPPILDQRACYDESSGPYSAGLHRRCVTSFVRWPRPADVDPSECRGCKPNSWIDVNDPQKRGDDSSNLQRRCETQLQKVPRPAGLLKDRYNADPETGICRDPPFDARCHEDGWYWVCQNHGKAATESRLVEYLKDGSWKPGSEEPSQPPAPSPPTQPSTVTGEQHIPNFGFESDVKLPDRQDPVKFVEMIDIHNKAISTMSDEEIGRLTREFIETTKQQQAAHPDEKLALVLDGGKWRTYPNNDEYDYQREKLIEAISRKGAAKNK